MVNILSSDGTRLLEACSCLCLTLTFPWLLCLVSICLIYLLGVSALVGLTIFIGALAATGTVRSRLLPPRLFYGVQRQERSNCWEEREREGWHAQPQYTVLWQSGNREGVNSATLPIDIGEGSSLNIFKGKLKTHIFMLVFKGTISRNQCILSSVGWDNNNQKLMLVLIIIKHCTHLKKLWNVYIFLLSTLACPFVPLSREIRPDSNIKEINPKAQLTLT